MWISVLAAIFTAYLLGNLNGAICVSLSMQDDVRSHGSGNAGLTNFVRSYGASKSLRVILIDAGKAFLACFVGRLLLDDYGYGLEGAAIAGVAVMLGHDFPALLGFKGGKGIMSGLFIALAVDWRIGLMILVVFAAGYLLSGYVSLGSVLAALTFGISFCLLHHSDPVVMICGIIMAILTVYMHRKNIGRLLKGVEPKTNLFKKK